MMKRASGMELRVISRGWNEKKKKSKWRREILFLYPVLHLVLKQGHELLMVMKSLL